MSEMRIWVIRATIFMLVALSIGHQIMIVQPVAVQAKSLDPIARCPFEIVTREMNGEQRAVSDVQQLADRYKGSLELKLSDAYHCVSSGCFQVRLKGEDTWSNPTVEPLDELDILYLFDIGYDYLKEYEVNLGSAYVNLVFEGLLTSIKSNPSDQGKVLRGAIRPVPIPDPIRDKNTLVNYSIDAALLKFTEKDVEDWLGGPSVEGLVDGRPRVVVIIRWYPPAHPMAYSTEKLTKDAREHVFVLDILQSGSVQGSKNYQVIREPAEALMKVMPELRPQFVEKISNEITETSLGSLPRKINDTRRRVRLSYESKRLIGPGELEEGKNILTKTGVLEVQPVQWDDAGKVDCTKAARINFGNGEAQSPLIMFLTLFKGVLAFVLTLLLLPWTAYVYRMLKTQGWV